MNISRYEAMRQQGYFDTAPKLTDSEMDKVRLDSAKMVLQAVDGAEGGEALAGKCWTTLMEICNGESHSRYGTRLPFDRDDADILTAARKVSPDAELLGPQEPPDDYRIWNRRQPDGTFKPLSQFFDEAVKKADAELTTGDMTRREYGEAQEPDWMTEAIARDADANDLHQTQESVRL